MLLLKNMTRIETCILRIAKFMSVLSLSFLEVTLENPSFVLSPLSSPFPSFLFSLYLTKCSCHKEPRVHYSPHTGEEDAKGKKQCFLREVSCGQSAGGQGAVRPAGGTPKRTVKSWGQQMVERDRVNVFELKGLQSLVNTKLDWQSTKAVPYSICMNGHGCAPVKLLWNVKLEFHRPCRSENTFLLGFPSSIM